MDTIFSKNGHHPLRLQPHTARATSIKLQVILTRTEEAAGGIPHNHIPRVLRNVAGFESFATSTNKDFCVEPSSQAPSHPRVAPSSFNQTLELTEIQANTYQIIKSTC